MPNSPKQPLEEEHAILQKIAKTTPSILYVFSLKEGKNIYSNHRVGEILGYTSAELLAMGNSLLQTLIHPDDVHIIADTLKKAAILEDDDILQIEYRMKTKKGKIVWLYDNVTVFKRDENGKAIEILGAAHDVTTFKEATEALLEERIRSLESSKFIAVGEMALGIGHEINNPLSVIQASAEQILEQLKNEKLSIEKIEKSSTRIIQTIERMTKIIRGLKSLARNGENDPFLQTSMDALLNETLEFCRIRLQRLNIKLLMQEAPKDIFIECRAVQLSQCIINLMQNSMDAIANQDKAWIEIELKDKQTAVEISVIDSGLGIPDAIADQINKPFFTTKAPGKGTGLGLSIVQRIIACHGGLFTLDRKFPHTKFTISIPKKQSRL